MDEDDHNLKRRRFNISFIWSRYTFLTGLEEEKIWLNTNDKNDYRIP